MAGRKARLSTINIRQQIYHKDSASGERSIFVDSLTIRRRGMFRFQSKRFDVE